MFIFINMYVVGVFKVCWWGYFNNNIVSFIFYFYMLFSVLGIIEYNIMVFGYMGKMFCFFGDLFIVYVYFGVKMNLCFFIFNNEVIRYR